MWFKFEHGIWHLDLPNGRPVLLLGPGTYARHLGPRILIWRELVQHKSAPLVGQLVRHVRFTLLTLEALSEIEEAEVVARKLSIERGFASYHGGMSSVFEFETLLEEGVYPIAAPLGYRDVPEILVLADFGQLKKVLPDRDSHRAIFAFDFPTDRVAVLPQKWYNHDYDDGENWIIQVCRDAESGHIVGVQKRNGVFQLSSQGTDLERWLERW
jgi:hypothetical protein